MDDRRPSVFLGPSRSLSLLSAPQRPWAPGAGPSAQNGEFRSLPVRIRGRMKKSTFVCSFVRKVFLNR